MEQRWTLTRLLTAVLALALLGAPHSNIVAQDAAVAAVPTYPTGVTASQGSYVDKIRVTWNAVSEASYYQVWRRVGYDGEYQFNISHLTNTYDDPAVSPANRYWYRISACNSDGCSAQSSPAEGWARLDTPTGVQATDGTYDTKVRVTWDTVSETETYLVYRGTSTQGWQTEWNAGLTSYYDDGSAVPGTQYYYWVAACNYIDCSTFSSYDGGYRRLSIPLGVQATMGTECDRVEVSWATPWGATYHKIQRCSAPDVCVEFTWDSTSPAYNDTTAVPSTRYNYAVKACAETHCSDWSSPANAYSGPPPAPYDLSASKGIYPDRVLLQWVSVGGTDTYTVYRYEQPVGYSPLATGVSGTSYNDYSALCDTTHSYRVAGCNHCGCGPLSESDSGWIAPCTPTATAAPQPTLTATATSLPRPTLTATTTSLPRPTLTATTTSLPRPTLTATATSRPRPTFTATATGVARPTSTATATSVARPTSTPTATRLARPTSTATATRVARPTSTPTATRRPWPTSTRPPGGRYEVFLPLVQRLQ